MKGLNANRFLYLILIGMVVLTACKKDDDPDGDNDDKADFDRAALLVHYADDLIIPAYLSFETNASDLKSLVLAFTSAPDQAGLDACRAKLHETTIAWQYAAPYQFGPAASNVLQDNVNVFPTDTAQISSNISAGNYDFEVISNLAAKGLPAIDYLLFGVGADDQQIIDWYTNGTHGDARRTYLNDVCAFLHDKAEAVHTAWISGGGNYRESFVSSTGTAVGSSTGLLLNAFNLSYEKHTRAGKLGIPAGALTFSQTPLPTHVEAYFRQENNVAYIDASLTACENIYKGIDGDGVDGTGFDDYLMHIEATYNGGSLHDAINGQIQDARLAVGNLSEPLSDFVVSNQAGALDTYAELQQLVVFWKVDMMSSLGVLITYQDTDGD